jgi:hypothetical protein
MRLPSMAMAEQGIEDVVMFPTHLVGGAEGLPAA